MDQFKRRHFLQLAGSTLASIGLSQTDFLRQCDRYGKALAQRTPRKLALLIGINEYDSPVNDLLGCVNDVELQRQLLIHRFGFNPTDILTLTTDTPERLPTRENIIQAFKEFLIGQARPGDVVVFHYSGHGALVLDPNPIKPGDEYKENGTLVPQDATPLREQGNNVQVPDIMGRSLFLLKESIQTDNLTVILDSCYSGASTRGGATVRADRSRLGSRGSQLIPSDAELELQQELLAELNMSEADFQRRRLEGIARGVALGSASRNQEALDGTFARDVPAGAFTYLLTRYLWQLTASEDVSRTETNLQRSTRITAYRQLQLTQKPVFEYADAAYKTQPIYFIDSSPTFAEAVITHITSEQIEFWLGGTSIQNLVATETIYTLVSPNGRTLTLSDETPMLLKQTRRVGLYGYGQLIKGDLNQLKPGILLREQVLGLQPNPTLKIQVDPNLEAQTSTALAALEGALVLKNDINRLEVSLLNNTQPKDYIFGRFTSEKRDKLNTNVDATSLPETLPIQGSLGLFNRQEIPITTTFGSINESVTAAVNRLKPKLRLFLARDILQGLTSSNTQLAVSGEIFSAARPNVSVPIITTVEQSTRTDDLSPTFKAKENIQIRIDNHESQQELYLSCLAIDSQGELIVLYPIDWEAPEEAARIDQGASLTVPREEDGRTFRVSGSGFLEILTLVSTQPLRNALKGLQAVARGRGISRGFVGTRGDESLELLNNLLGDLNELSRSNRATVESVSVDPEVNALDKGVLTVFSTPIEVVE